VDEPAAAAGATSRNVPTSLGARGARVYLEPGQAAGPDPIAE